MSEDYERDGVTYYVNATKQPRGWHGHWLCEECGDGGAHSVLVGSEAKAIEKAKTNLLMHHGAKHKPK